MSKILVTLAIILSPILSFSMTDGTSSSDWKTSGVSKRFYGRNFIGLELLGRAMGYSVNFDRSLEKKFSLGGGFSYYQWNFENSEVTSIMIPVYMQYYFAGHNSHRGFAALSTTLGYNKVTSNGEKIYERYQDNYLYSVAADGTSVYPDLGLGYEFRARSGFTARVTSYLRYYKELNTVLPWGGLTLGSHF